MNTVWLMRHGENRANLTGEFSHRIIDYPLTLLGWRQARCTATYLASFPIAAVYASPLQRAKQTAACIAEPHQLPVQIIEAFREVDVGRLEREPPTKAAWVLHDRIFAAWYAGDHAVAFPEGENYHTLWGRMQAGLRQATANRCGEHIVIVGHGGLFNTTIKDLCPQADLAALLAADFPNGAVSQIELHGGAGGLQGVLKYWAYRAHLDALTDSNLEP